MSDSLPPSAGEDGIQRAPPHLFTHIDLSRPRYDQTTFSGRARHFFEVANPVNVFASSSKLEAAATLVKLHKQGLTPAGTTEEQLWAAKRLYDSAYHPDTGDKMFLAGRMSFQVPGNMSIVGCMLTFYKTPAGVIFWQWANQSFNAVVNYTNRSGDMPITMKQLAVPYVAATTGATATALVLNKYIAKRVPALIGRLIPFAAVCAANCINIPLMRQRELKYGIPVTDKEGNRLGNSKKAAERGILQVTVSRIVMSMPGMLFPPLLMNYLDKKMVLQRIPWANAPLQILAVGVSLIFATPLCCAIFPQQSSIPVASLERDLQQSISRVSPGVSTVYFNKGL